MFRNVYIYNICFESAPSVILSSCLFQPLHVQLTSAKLVLFK